MRSRPIRARRPGLLSVHTRVSIGSEFLTDALPGFLRLYPRIKLRLWLTEEPRDILDSKIDVSIRIGVPDDPSLMIRRLSPGMERVLFASAAYLRDHPPIRHPQDLLLHNCLSIPQEGDMEGGQASWFYRDTSGVQGAEGQRQPAGQRRPDDPQGGAGGGGYRIAARLA